MGAVMAVKRSAQQSQLGEMHISMNSAMARLQNTWVSMDELVTPLSQEELDQSSEDDKMDTVLTEDELITPLTEEELEESEVPTEAVEDVEAGEFELSDEQRKLMNTPLSEEELITELTEEEIKDNTPLSEEELITPLSREELAQATDSLP